jgi:hypothetical protein
MNELVPQSIRDLLDFYSQNHADARFGDLDISALQQAVQTIDAAAHEVELAEAAVAQAREQFRDMEAELFTKANRTISFLKIHVEQDSAQLAQLESISSGIAAHRRKAKPTTETAAAATAEPRQRRTRKEKASATAEENQESSPEVLDDALLLSDALASEPIESTVVAAEANRTLSATASLA